MTGLLIIKKSHSGTFLIHLLKHDEITQKF